MLERSKEEPRKRGSGMNGGFRLSALFLGVVGVAVWAAFFLAFIVQFGGPREITVGEWVLSGGGFIVSFLVPWGLVRAIAWVIEVFKNLNNA